MKKNEVNETKETKEAKPLTTKKETKNLVAAVTNKIVSNIEESGTLPWEREWVNSMPRNFSSRTPYSGINIFTLWSAQEDNGFKQGWWGTAKQIERLKGTIKDDAAPVEIVFMKPFNTTNAHGEDKKIMLCNSFLLYNIEQTEGLSGSKSGWMLNSRHNSRNSMTSRRSKRSSLQSRSS